MRNASKWREIVSGPKIIRDLPDLYKRQIKKWFQEQVTTIEQDKFEQVAKKISEYMKQHPQAKWSEIRRKFNLSRSGKRAEKKLFNLFYKKEI